MFLILLRDSEFVKLLSTGTSFLLSIMTTQNVDFRKNEPDPLHAELHVTSCTCIFHLNPILLLMMKMSTKQFLFHFRKIRAEHRCTII